MLGTDPLCDICEPKCLYIFTVLRGVNFFKAGTYILSVKADTHLGRPQYNVSPVHTLLL